MPRIPTLAGRQVEPSSAPIGPMQSLLGRPEEFGSQVSGAVFQLGGVIEKEADAWRRIALEHKLTTEKAEADDIFQRARDEARKLRYDFRELQGKEAVGSSERLEPMLREMEFRWMSQLKTGLQRNHFRNRWRYLAANTKEYVAAHEFTQGKALQLQAHEADLTGNIADAVENFGDPGAFLEADIKGTEQIKEYWGRYDQGIVEDKIREYREDLTTAVLQEKLAANVDIQGFYNTHKENIRPALRSTIGDRVKDQVLDNFARDYVNALYDSGQTQEQVENTIRREVRDAETAKRLRDYSDIRGVQKGRAEKAREAKRLEEKEKFLARVEESIRFDPSVPLKEQVSPEQWAKLDRKDRDDLWKYARFHSELRATADEKREKDIKDAVLNDARLAIQRNPFAPIEKAIPSFSQLGLTAEEKDSLYAYKEAQMKDPFGEPDHEVLAEWTLKTHTELMALSEKDFLDAAPKLGREADRFKILMDKAKTTPSPDDVHRKISGWIKELEDEGTKEPEELGRIALEMWEQIQARPEIVSNFAEWQTAQEAALTPGLNKGPAWKGIPTGDEIYTIWSIADNKYLVYDRSDGRLVRVYGRALNRETGKVEFLERPYKKALSHPRYFYGKPKPINLAQPSFLGVYHRPGLKEFLPKLRG